MLRTWVPEPHPIGHSGAVRRTMQADGDHAERHRLDDKKMLQLRADELFERTTTNLLQQV